MFNLVSLVFLSASVGVTVRPFGVVINSVIGRGRGKLTCSVRDFLYGTNDLTKCLFPFVFTTVNVDGVTPGNVVPSSIVCSFCVNTLVLVLYIVCASIGMGRFPPRRCTTCRNVARRDGGRGAGVFGLLIGTPGTF